MIIIHCVKEDIWKLYENCNYYGKEYMDTCGFIHCSEIETYPLVAPNFKEVKEKLLLLVIDTDKVEPEIKWEDLENCGTKFPHIYGMLNKNAIVNVLPHLWSKDREWIINSELKS